jgi:predicted GNAT family acetyltransferase
MEKKIEIHISAYIKEFLTPYLEENYIIEPICFKNHSLVISGKSKKENQGILVLVVNISHKNKQIHIPNIFIPHELRGQGIGMKLIRIIFIIAKHTNYKLFLTDMVPSFYDRMIKLGAYGCVGYNGYEDAVYIHADEIFK